MSRHQYQDSQPMLWHQGKARIAKALKSNVVTLARTSEQCRNIDIQSHDIEQGGNNLDFYTKLRCCDISHEIAGTTITQNLDTRIQCRDTKFEPRHCSSDVSTSAEVSRIEKTNVVTSATTSNQCHENTVAMS